ncbi:hypothetical protein [Chitinophaga barathri]|uniref:Uncharacterized protein n=1 Tax=Chitinophaga barathri TaxID=1647451 RepID=A0A3N4M5X2_9BACT|nr:hypothetical protein [Chitinophaga barathri]RPD38445.1 hypothetical protein EG028_24550 [Chitinophaga barathri]
MENIEELTKEYSAVLLKVQERRACWQAKSKPFLIRFLAGITEKYKLKWKAGANEMMLGLEAVYLVFDHEPSGIVEQSPFSVVQKMKIGGFLSFSQTRNGQIVVWISYPFIDGMNDEKPKNDMLETIEPEEITEDSVTRYIQKFLMEVIEWENNAREEIGFVRHR